MALWFAWRDLLADWQVIGSCSQWFQRKWRRQKHLAIVRFQKMWKRYLGQNNHQKSKEIAWNCCRSMRIPIFSCMSTAPQILLVSRHAVQRIFCRILFFCDVLFGGFDRRPPILPAGCSLEMSSVCEIQSFRPSYWEFKASWQSLQRQTGSNSLKQSIHRLKHIHAW